MSFQNKIGGKSTGRWPPAEGRLFAWGRNNGGHGGRLGQGDTTNRSSPVQIGSATNWVSHGGSALTQWGLTSTGKLYTVGSGQHGALGHNNTTDISTIVQVGSLTDWGGQIASGQQQHFAIKTDGTLWCWGRNRKGSLGLGDETARSSPVQVGGLTTWSWQHNEYFFTRTSWFSYRLVSSIEL